MIGRQGGSPRPAGRPQGGSNGSGGIFSALCFGRSKLLRDAYDLAADAHAGQSQESDDSPYIEHPVRVALVLKGAGFGDVVVAAGLLHDTVENSEVKIYDLDLRFGQPVADLVSAMTEPGGFQYFRDRKAAHRMQIADAGREAAAIFAADKIVNARSLRQAVAHQGEERVGQRLSNPLELKVEHYCKTLEMLDDLQPQSSLVALLREELEAFAWVRPWNAGVAS